jgi:hypothetical protein
MDNFPLSDLFTLATSYLHRDNRTTHAWLTRASQSGVKSALQLRELEQAAQIDCALCKSPIHRIFHLENHPA